MSAVLLVAVVADELEERAIEILREEGVPGMTWVSAHGLGFPEHMTFFGLTYLGIEQVLLCVVRKPDGERIVERLNRELDLLAPFQGLAFCLDIEHMSGQALTGPSAHEPGKGGGSAR